MNLLTIPQYCEMFDLDRTTVYDWVTKGKLTFIDSPLKGKEKQFVLLDLKEELAKFHRGTLKERNKKVRMGRPRRKRDSE